MHPPLPEASPGFRRGMQVLAGQVADDIALALAQDARAKQGVKINRKLFDQAVGNGESGS
jgi:hypothetical protein